MGLLTDSATKAIKKARKRPDVPGYFMFVAPIAALILAISIFFQLIEGPPAKVHVAESSTQQTVPLANQATTTTSATGTTQTTLASTATTAPITGPTVAVPQGTGTTTIQVPLDAYNVAEAAAKATVTGDTTGITLSAGSIAPQASGSWSSGATITLTVISNDPTQYVFDGIVDPDGPGPQAPQYPTIRVLNAGSGWAWATG